MANKIASMNIWKEETKTKTTEQTTAAHTAATTEETTAATTEETTAATTAETTAASTAAPTAETTAADREVLTGRKRRKPIKNEIYDYKKDPDYLYFYKYWRTDLCVYDWAKAILQDLTDARKDYDEAMERYAERYSAVCSGHAVRYDNPLGCKVQTSPEQDAEYMGIFSDQEEECRRACLEYVAASSLVYIALDAAIPPDLPTTNTQNRSLLLLRDMLIWHYEDGLSYSKIAAKVNETGDYEDMDRNTVYRYVSYLIVTLANIWCERGIINNGEESEGVVQYVTRIPANDAAYAIYIETHGYTPETVKMYRCNQVHEYIEHDLRYWTLYEANLRKALRYNPYALPTPSPVHQWGAEDEEMREMRDYYAHGQMTQFRDIQQRQKQN